MPAGWSIRLTVVEVKKIALSPGTIASRADPNVLRAQRQMSDPAAAAALAAPLRQAFPGRPIQAEAHSLFIPNGMLFVRESSVAVPLASRAGDDALLERLADGAVATTLAVTPSGATSAEPPTQAARRAHLRLIQ
jgi:hypothetical protein